MKHIITLMLFTTIMIAALSVAAHGEGSDITLIPIGRYNTDLIDESAAEIVTYDRENQRLIVVNSATDGGSLDFIDISDPTEPELAFSISMADYGSGANSVDYYEGVIATAVEADNTQEPGSVVFFDADGNELAVVTVGALPDMLTFTPDGSKVLVANEGQPNSDYTVDPEGSISIIDLSDGVENLTDDAVTTLGFDGVDIGEDVRVFGPGATPAQDLEPEYITVAPDGSTAYVAIQEANAIAIVDLEANVITEVVSLGFKDHNAPGNSLDASDRDDAIQIVNQPVWGMYQPDGIAAYEVDGETYIITANEGDSRDYDGFSEEERIGDVDLDPETFPNAEEIQEDENLGRLKITSTLGDNDGDGDYDELYVYGGRSFSILNADAEMIYDSRNQFEILSAELFPDGFNSEGTNESFDDRSDDKGPEPESVVVGEIDGHIYAFIGLERPSGIMIFDVNNPTNVSFVNYVNTNIEPTSTARDIAPEGLKFISAEDSPTGTPLLAVAYEVSGTTTIFAIESVEED